jgi:hypothetical protein
MLLTVRPLVLTVFTLRWTLRVDHAEMFPHIGVEHLQLAVWAFEL